MTQKLEPESLTEIFPGTEVLFRREGTVNSSEEESIFHEMPPLTFLNYEEAFPLDVFPERFRALFRECDRVYKTGALNPLSALTLTGAAVGKGLRLTTWQGRSTSANLYAVIACPSGTGKSGTLSEYLRPICEAEKERLEDFQSDVLPDLKAREKVKAVQLKGIEAQAKKGAKGIDPDKDYFDEQSLVQELKKLEQELADIQRQMHPPCMRVADITSEALGELLSHNGGTLLSASSECSRMFQELLGGYSKKGLPQDHIWNSAYSCESVVIHRIGREPNMIEEACLAALWMPQPDKLSWLMGDQTIMSGGLLARALLIHLDLPPKRDSLEAGISPEVREQWDSFIASLLETYRFEDEAEHAALSDEAISLLLDYQYWLADRQERDLHDVRPFAARWTENACRIALNLHVMEHGEHAHIYEVTKETARGAIRIMEWISQQTIDVVGEGREAKKEERLNKLIELLRSKPDEQETVRNMKRRHGFTHSELEQLVESASDILAIEAKEGTGRPSMMVKLVP